jgi:predicted DNA-binding protein (MmcQ/YjbR family)
VDIEHFREFCLNLPSVAEDCPFGPDTLVFKVKSKMFALCSISDFGDVNLKCDPEKAIELREEYSQIKGAFHMNKKHWNSVDVKSLKNDLIEELVIHSYKLVKAGLNRKEKSEIELGI